MSCIRSIVSSARIAKTALHLHYHSLCVVEAIAETTRESDSQTAFTARVTWQLLAEITGGDATVATTLVWVGSELTAVAATVIAVTGTAVTTASMLAVTAVDFASRLTTTELVKTSMTATKTPSHSASVPTVAAEMFLSQVCCCSMKHVKGPHTAAS